MASSVLALLCLLSSCILVNGYYFWPFGVRTVGFYDDPCGPTLYRMRAQGARDLPDSIFIPPPRPTKRGPRLSANRTVVEVSPEAALPNPPAPSPIPPRRRTKPPPPPPRRPFFVDPFNRPIDPWLALALDLDPMEYPDGTTLSPPPQEPRDSPRSVRPRRVQRQAPATKVVKQTPQAKPKARKPPVRTKGPRFNRVECYCDSHWDCNGPARARGGRYDPQCDSGYGLVCCCR